MIDNHNLLEDLKISVCRQFVSIKTDDYDTFETLIFDRIINPENRLRVAVGQSPFTTEQRDKILFSCWALCAEIVEHQGHARWARRNPDASLQAFSRIRLQFPSNQAFKLCAERALSHGVKIMAHEPISLPDLAYDNLAGYPDPLRMNGGHMSKSHKERN